MSAVPRVIEDLVENFRTDCVGFAGFTILIWDHLDTFTTEVEYIWKGKKGPLVYLFVLNRYLTPLGFIINLFAYLSPMWTLESSWIGSVCPQPILIFVVVAMGIGWLIVFSVQAWLLSNGLPVIHNPISGVRGNSFHASAPLPAPHNALNAACTMIFPPAVDIIATSVAWLPLLYESLVLILTLIKTVPVIVQSRRAPQCLNGSTIMKQLFQDGLIYYSAIFAVDGGLTIMFISAPPGLKNIISQLPLIVTVTMMSRITLNLKKLGSEKKLMGTTIPDSGPIIFRSNGRRNTHTITTNTNIEIVSYEHHVDPDG
ncbi:hypothetical protein DFH08DRAFT_975903 [Mycena albidolilacea]|uniref:DUF6533 domain-containing protein n=1 Tax=Mycena albidolilacea TaxID=1033008 RepID=A0AAD7EA65_9AGAR|nr:hypothetical protein DFH08DRAFT_975903 [Mycena albidolilacea]